jgi:hypothetical protein
MNGAQYGKGDRPRNNWGPKWYASYDTINWHRQDGRPPQNGLISPKSRTAPLSSGKEPDGVPRQ